MVKRECKKVVYVPEDLLEEVVEASRMEGEYLSKFVEQALRLSVKFSRHVGGIKKLAELLEAVQTHRILGGSIVDLDIINYLTCKAYRDEKEQVQAKWYESGMFYGEYLKNRFENPVEAFGNLLEASRWELSNVDLNIEGNQVKIRCISTRLTIEGIGTLVKFIEGAMHSLGYETVSRDIMKGIILLEFKYARRKKPENRRKKPFRAVRKTIELVMKGRTTKTGEKDMRAVDQSKPLQAMTELDRLSDEVSAPAAVKEKAALIYRKALDEGLVSGRSIAAIIAASLYAACRITGTPRKLREISEASLANKKDVARCYRLLLRKLNIRMPIADPLIYITKIAQRSNIPRHIQADAVKIINQAKEKHVSAGKDPMGLAAAALYIACKQAGEKKTQNDIAYAAGVTDVTLRTQFKNLKKELKLDVPN